MRRIVMAQRVGVKAREQTRRRVDATRKLVDDQIATLRRAADELLEIKPVGATLDLLVGTIDNTANFIKRQAELTRERAR